MTTPASSDKVYGLTYDDRITALEAEIQLQEERISALESRMLQLENILERSPTNREVSSISSSEPTSVKRPSLIVTLPLVKKESAAARNAEVSVTDKAKGEEGRRAEYVSSGKAQKRRKIGLASRVSEE
ncbi:hypothetical protein ACLMJK_001132 [Lecanora helva]